MVEAVVSTTAVPLPTGCCSPPRDPRVRHASLSASSRAVPSTCISSSTFPGSMMASQVKGGWMDSHTVSRYTVTVTVASIPLPPFTEILCIPLFMTGDREELAPQLHRMLSCGQWISIGGSRSTTSDRASAFVYPTRYGTGGSDCCLWLGGVLGASGCSWRHDSRCPCWCLPGSCVRVPRVQSRPCVCHRRHVLAGTQGRGESFPETRGSGDGCLPVLQVSRWKKRARPTGTWHQPRAGVTRRPGPGARGKQTRSWSMRGQTVIHPAERR
jgi:hypothetical protein